MVVNLFCGGVDFENSILGYNGLIKKVENYCL